MPIIAPVLSTYVSMAAASILEPHRVAALPGKGGVSPIFSSHRLCLSPEKGDAKVVGISWCPKHNYLHKVASPTSPRTNNYP